MIELSALSKSYHIRRLDESDAESILALCAGNAQYYRYCEAAATREQILRDLRITPPGIAPSAKYYLGFWRKETLAAVMDLIDGYPEPETAFIGFFMMNRELQGQGLGSAIIRETAAYLKTAGKTAVRLGIDKGNPQSTHFWKKNGFTVLNELDSGGGTILVAEKAL